MIKPKVLVYSMPKKFVLVPTTAKQSAENTVPRLLHHPVERSHKERSELIHRMRYRIILSSSFYARSGRPLV